jgi:hypothetical protein
VLIALVAILGIGAWIGWTMATTPPPKPIEEIEAEEKKEDAAIEKIPFNLADKKPFNLPDIETTKAHEILYDGLAGIRSQDKVS